MDKTKVTKMVAKHVAAWSTAFAVGNIIRNNVVPKNLIQQIEVQVAAIVLGYMVAERAEEAVSKFIDKIIAGYNEAVSKDSCV